MKIIAEQNKAGGSYIADRAADADASGANGVTGAAAGAAGDDRKDVFNAAIDKLFPETK